MRVEEPHALLPRPADRRSAVGDVPTTSARRVGNHRRRRLRLAAALGCDGQSCAARSGSARRIRCTRRSTGTRTATRDRGTGRPLSPLRATSPSSGSISSSFGGLDAGVSAAFPTLGRTINATTPAEQAGATRRGAFARPRRSLREEQHDNREQEHEESLAHRVHPGHRATSSADAGAAEEDDERRADAARDRTTPTSATAAASPTAVRGKLARVVEDRVEVLHLSARPEPTPRTVS